MIYLKLKPILIVYLTKTAVLIEQSQVFITNQSFPTVGQIKKIFILKFLQRASPPALRTVVSKQFKQSHLIRQRCLR